MNKWIILSNLSFMTTKSKLGSRPTNLNVLKGNKFEKSEFTLVTSFKFEQQQSELCKSCGYYYHENHPKCYLQIIQIWILITTTKWMDASNHNNNNQQQQQRLSVSYRKHTEHEC
ncbi:hypothetical protein DERP_008127 [Dermatophagoides pteronyssinus]|uniref:Uncharacterized protein n=1 Tax=Dermatophagoides pteronyssinus TaxID=6956 RepID=A0ABQ8JJX2_DERPT|nr:hypothetical protein DERP_008127 [Dermatophagoides pteronyssinus]